MAQDIRQVSAQLTFKIQPVTELELSSVLEVYRQCEDFLALGPVACASVEMVLADIQLSRDAGGIFCGIHVPQKGMVGVIDFVPHHYLGDPRHAFIELLMIEPSSRQNGLGAAVVVWVEEEICSNPIVTTIQAAVQVNNPLAVAFWQKQGYRITNGPEVQPDQTITFSLEKPLVSV
jgi:ribosomal protein S18 acetylase RimI-like enzyme